jgi:hypothetical protein
MEDMTIDYPLGPVDIAQALLAATLPPQTIWNFQIVVTVPRARKASILILTRYIATMPI